MEKILQAKKELLDRLEEKETQYLIKNKELKEKENQYWLGEEINKCSNDKKRTAFVSTKTVTEKQSVDELKCEINQIKRRLKLLDQQFQMLTILYGGE